MAWRENVTFGKAKVRELQARVFKPGSDPVDGTEGSPLATDVKFTVGTAGGSSTNVQVYLQDATGATIAKMQAVQAFLSGDSGGDGVVSTAPNTGVSIANSNGNILEEYTSAKTFALQTNSDGRVDLTIDDSGTSKSTDWYLVVVLPTGHIAVSPAINTDTS